MLYLLNLAVVLSWALLFVLALKVIFFVTFSTKHYKRASVVGRKRLGKYKPLVSIIVPCYNEELVLNNCVRSLLKQDYPNFEIIVVNDGSSDATKIIGRKLAKEYPKKLRFYSKQNGGKASTLNYGIKRASGEIVVCMDADSMFLNDTVKNLVLSFYDPKVVAVGGSVKVANRRKFINKHQAAEYITGLNLQRRTFAYLGCMQVISGAIGAFRKGELLKAGGYSNDTVVEDMDVTISMVKSGRLVEFNGNAIAYTEAPESIKDFIKQRYRWTFGGFQVLKKHKNIIFNRKFNSLGLVGIPYFLIFPWFDVLVSILFVVSIFRVLYGGGLIDLLAFYVAMSVIQGTLLVYSLLMDKEDKKLALLAGVDSLWYNHLICLVTVRAGINFARGRSTSWNKVVRLGKNFNPTLT